MTAISCLLNNLQQTSWPYEGKTWRLFSKDGSLHSFRQAITEEEKTEPGAVGWWHNSIFPSNQDGFSVSPCYRLQERSGYDISRFYVITRQKARERIEGKRREMKDRGCGGWLRWRICSYLVLPVQWAAALPERSLLKPTNRNPGSGYRVDTIKRRVDKKSWERFTENTAKLLHFLHPPYFMLRPF
jgi:hypothetical protein